MSSAEAKWHDGAAELADLQRIFALQRQNRWALAATTVRERVERLERLSRAIDTHREALTRAVHEDFRKSAMEFEITELSIVQLEIAHMAKALGKWLKPKKVATPLWLFGTRSETRYEPKGSVLILAPWNYPFQLLFNPLLAAIASGNVVMLRPSEKVPHIAAAMAALIRETFPENEVALVQGEVAVAEALLNLPFDHIFFTGSTRVGKRVASKAAEHLATVTLELGGKSPAVVDETADIASAAERIIWGKFINAGQTCVAPDFALVHKQVEGAFLEAAKKAIAHAYGATDAERRSSPDFARLVDRPAFDRLTRLLQAGVDAGGKIEVGGQSEASERYLAPTLVSNVTPGSPLMEEELFGPILPVLTWESESEVLSLAHKTGKPLALYVFSEDREKIESLLRKTTAGGTVINNVVQHLANPDLPFGGVGSSGQGSYHGEAGIRAFSHERAVMRQGRPASAKLLYPPYGPRTMQVLRLLKRLFA